MATAPLVSQRAGSVPEYLPLNEVFEVDSDEEGDFSSSDEDEDVIDNDERHEEDHVSDILDGIESTPGVLTTSAISSSRRRSANGINNTDNADQSRDVLDDGTEKDESGIENKFLVALMTAARSYSSRLRIPSAPSSSSSASTTQFISSGAPTPSSVNNEVDSEDSDDGNFSSEDEEPDNEIKPTLNAEEAAQLFYNPAMPWASYGNTPIEDSVVIERLHEGAMCEAFIKRGTINGRRITYISKTWLLCQKWDGFFSEMVLYAHPAYLRPLQGSVIPTIIGVYLVDGAISVAMELPSPAFWVEASEDMSDHLKRKVIAAFDLIHDRGVLHNDVELRHMLIGADESVTIIDFQGSRALNPIKDVDLEAATKAEILLEKRKVMYKLNYNGAQMQESEKRDRVFGRRDRNAKRRERRKQNAMHTPAGAKVVVPKDDESEPEDPDDILNPIVEPHIWRDNWLGEEFDPVCYVVPGQDQMEVKAILSKFAAREHRNIEKDRTRAIEDNGLVAKGESTSSRSTLNSKSISQASECEKLPIEVPAYASPGLISELTSSNSALKLKSTSQARERGNLPIEFSPHTSPRPSIPITNSQLTPILPTRVNLKRNREDNNDDLSEDDLEDVRPQKKHQSTSSSKKLRINGDVKSISTPNSSDSLSTTLAASASSSVEDTTMTAAPDMLPVADDQMEKIPAIIHVPYEGYTGPGGFTMPNTFSPKQISVMRRVWIMQDNVRRCKEEGLPYPLAKRFGLTSSTEIEEYTLGHDGKKRKLKPLFSRGALKRAQREMKLFGKAKKDALMRWSEYMKQREKEFEMDIDALEGPSVKLEDDKKPSDDGVVEGPKILTWVEFFDYETSQQARVQAPADLTAPPGPSSVPPSVQPRSILRRKLSPLEEEKQRTFDEWLMKYHPQESDDDEDDDDVSPQIQDTPPPKHLRVAAQPSKILTASGEVGFQKLSHASTSFVPSPAAVNYSAASGSSSLSVQPTSFFADPSLPSRLQLNPIPRPIDAMSLHQSTSTSYTTSSFVEPTEFDSDSSEDHDQEAPSSSSLTPEMPVSQGTPSSEAGNITEFNPHVRSGLWISPAERQERADAAAYLVKVRQENGGVVGRISNVIGRALGY